MKNKLIYIMINLSMVKTLFRTFIPFMLLLIWTLNGISPFLQWDEKRSYFSFLKSYSSEDDQTDSEEKDGFSFDTNDTGLFYSLIILKKIELVQIHIIPDLLVPSTVCLRKIHKPPETPTSV